MVSYISGRWWRWKFWNILRVALFLICIVRTVLSCQADCDKTLTESSGIFTSPCYPSDYPSSQTCTWTLQAPAGFVLQLTFLDFELEEAQGCVYDYVIVNNGASSIKFCGLTANGLTLNSSSNVMIVSFQSDFSVQKKGFSISYRQVAVALRNQKVTFPQNNKDVIRVASSVVIPTLSQFTVCFEIDGQTQSGSGVIFTYSTSDPFLSFGNTGNSMDLIIGNVTCSINDLVTLAEFTSNMQPFCATWSNVNGAVGVYFRNSYRSKLCSGFTGMKITGGGSFELGRGKKQGQNFVGLIYDFRLWSFAMTPSELSALTCDVVGNVLDWDNSFWEIPATYVQTDPSLSCSTVMPSTIPQTTTCVSSGVGCPASLTTTTSSTVNTNTIPTNARSNDLSITVSYTTTPSITLPATTVQSSSSETTYQPTTTTTSTSTAAATNPLNNYMSNEFTYYRISFIVSDDQHSTYESIQHWLNQTLNDWNRTYYLTNISILPELDSSITIRRYFGKALLVYRNTTGKPLIDTDIKNWLKSISGSNFTFDSISVNVIENCPAEEMPLHYKWPESKPSVTHFIPCFPYKEQNSSRTCMISAENYSSYWNTPDLGNCKDIESIEVSQENAVEVAVQLADITNNELSTEELSKVVTVVTKLVNVARINFTLANSVVSIISNVMNSSESAQLAASEMALKTMDKLMQKIEFEGPSLTIRSKNLAVGISATNSSTFNGASFSALNSSEPQIVFESEVSNPLASVSLPDTLLHNLSEADAETVSRINFMFFSKTGLFQDQQNKSMLNSYVVASSVGNLSISNLKDPIQIEVTHLQHPWNQNRSCVFWDFSLNNGTGGWNSEGCYVSPMSNSKKTVCLCNHLTHFGVLMDLSGSSPYINERNTKILTFITYIGCGISAIFSAVTILTYIAFEKLRRDYPSKILMNLSTSLLFLNMTFLLDGWLASYEMPGLCMAVAAFLHFFLLTSFTWMGLESVHMYIALVKVFNTYIRRYILKFCIVGWGFPAVIVTIVVAADKNSYGKEFYGKGENSQGLSEFCWIRSKVVFYVTCVAYFCVIFILNVAMFIVVMMQICGRNGKRNNRTLQEEVLRNLRSVISLTFLLGMTWGFAFFAWGPVNLAFMYLFSIFNSLQGLFIFIFHCALKENVQKQWRRYLCCGKLRLADNSDWSKTATNNTKKVSSDNIGKSLSSSSFGSTTVNWTSKAKVTLNPFAKRHSSSGKPYSTQSNQKCSTTDSDASTSSILPVHQVLDKVKGYCSVRSDNFYKNIMLSDSFSHSTKF